MLDNRRILRVTRPLDVADKIREFATMKLAPENTIVTLIITPINGNEVTIDRRPCESFIRRPAKIGYGYDQVDIEDVIRECKDMEVEEIAIRRCSCTFEKVYDGWLSVFKAQETDTLKQELIEKAWHPSRMAEWCLDTEEAADIGSLCHS